MAYTDPDELDGEFEFEHADILSNEFSGILSADYMGNITYKIESAIGNDEIIFHIPITNVDTKGRWFYVNLYDQSGKFIDSEPDLIRPRIGSGETHTITISSRLKTWHVGDVQGQTVKFELKSKDSLLAGYKIVERKTGGVKTHPPVVPLVGYIGNITYKIEPSIGMDEITFNIPITNVDTKGRWFYVNLYDQSGNFIDSEPDIIRPSLGPGNVHTLIVSSKLKTWHIGHVQGQTVKFELKSKDSLLKGYTVVETKTSTVEPYTEETPPVTPPTPSTTRLTMRDYFDNKPKKINDKYWGCSGVSKTSADIVMVTSDNSIIEKHNIDKGSTDKFATGHRVKVTNVYLSGTSSYADVEIFEPSVTPPVVCVPSWLCKTSTGKEEDGCGNVRITTSCTNAYTAMQMVVGNIPMDLRYDLNGNGTVDTGDATLLAAGGSLVPLPPVVPPVVPPVTPPVVPPVVPPVTPPVVPPVVPPVIPPVVPPYVPPVIIPIITPEEAAAGIQAGKQYWIKCTLPLLDLLPGLPYFAGIPIFPGFRISETM